MPRRYLRWGKPSFDSMHRVRQQVEKARQFKKGEQVLAGGQKGEVIEITDTGGIRVRIGKGTPRQFHPDHVQKIST